MRGHHYEASLEVLTDGSELTAPAIFLTIRRCAGGSSGARRSGGQNDTADDECDGEDGPSQHGFVYQRQCKPGGANDADEGTIVARYGLTGLPTLAGRLASDQSYKLLQGGALRAILMPSLVGNFHDGTYGMRGASVGGFPALFLSLVQSGYKIAGQIMSGKSSSKGDSSDSAPEDCDRMPEDVRSNNGGYGDVAIVGPSGTHDNVDDILGNMFGNVRRRPSIRTCEVPVASNWWEVYTDTYVKIWAQSVPHFSSGVSLCGSCAVAKEAQRSGHDELSSSSSSSSGDSDSSEENASNRSDASTNSKEYSIVYMVMLLSSREEVGHLHSHSHCFAIMPQTVSSTQCPVCRGCGSIMNSREKRWETIARYWYALRNLPQEIVSGQKGSGEMLDFILHLDPFVNEGESGCDKPCPRSKQSEKGEPLSKRRRTEWSRNVAGLSGRRVPCNSISVPSFASKQAVHHLATFPDRQCCESSGDDPSDSVDSGILIRARQRSQLLHDNLPFAFPLASNSLASESDTHNNQETVRTNVDEPDASNVRDGSLSSAPAIQLNSCTSVILNGRDVNNASGKTGKGNHPFVFVNRRGDIRDYCQQRTPCPTELDLVAKGDASGFRTNVELLKCAFLSGPCICGECKDDPAGVTTDDNEIDLDSSSSSECDKPQTPVRDQAVNVDSANELNLASPHILMLGTGCATPAPLRGSSAYALFLPTALDGAAALALSAIIECGEGTLTGLLRNLPSHLSSGNEDSMHPKLSRLDFQLHQVHFIWISHSHLDHYGDLPVVVQAIANAKQKVGSQTQQSAPLLVIAPSKVLRYLDILLHQPRAPTDKHNRLYVGVTHRDFQHSPFAAGLRSSFHKHMLPAPAGMPYEKYAPFAMLRNVEVEHCRDAFALLLHLNVPPSVNNRRGDFVLCFSGDTRPSVKLVQACRSGRQTQLANHAVSLLIHEATFKHDSHGQKDAVGKRHSTTSEALDIATRMKAKACILTHFSQRYKHISIEDACSGQDPYPFSWGIAMDGMMIPLTNRALSSLSRVSQCVDALIIRDSGE